MTEPDWREMTHSMLRSRTRAVLELFKEFDPTNYRTVRTRDLRHLVRVAWRHAEISGSKARELLGLDVMEWRAVENVWTEQDGIDAATDAMVPEPSDD